MEPTNFQLVAQCLNQKRMLVGCEYATSIQETQHKTVQTVYTATKQTQHKTVQTVYTATKQMISMCHNYYRFTDCTLQFNNDHVKFNVLIVSSCNCNNFVTLAKHKVPCRWCRCVETCRSAYGIWNIVNVCVVHLLVWIINWLHKMYGTYIKIRDKNISK
jgi:hypothetical protein